MVPPQAAGHLGETLIPVCIQITIGRPLMLVEQTCFFSNLIYLGNFSLSLHIKFLYSFTFFNHCIEFHNLSYCLWTFNLLPFSFLSFFSYYKQWNDEHLPVLPEVWLLFLLSVKSSMYSRYLALCHMYKYFS